MKKAVLAFSLAMTAATGAQADFISGDLTLRDAIYIYNRPINSYWYTVVRGYNCDVMQLVLDVESGSTDIWLTQGTDLNVHYPDTIQSWHAMFSYALYRNEQDKWFGLAGSEQTPPGYQVGSATVFGYCYSTKPDAYVFLWDEATETCTYSDGSQAAC